MRPRFLSLAALALAGWLAACDGPCQSLADRICSCEPNRVEEQNCVEQVRVAMSDFEPTEDEASVCSDLLDTCDCEALEREDLGACGLSK